MIGVLIHNSYDKLLHRSLSVNLVRKEDVS